MFDVRNLTPMLKMTNAEIDEVLAYGLCNQSGDDWDEWRDLEAEREERVSRALANWEANWGMPDWY